MLITCKADGTEDRPKPLTITMFSSPQTCACVDLSVELNAAALDVLRSSVERAAEQAKEAVRAQLLRELDAEEEVRVPPAVPQTILGRYWSRVV